MRNKTTAVILAVIFGWFAWLYTYKEDSWKFWLGTIGGVLAFFGLIFSMIIIEIGEPIITDYMLLIFDFLGLVGLYLWAIIDYARQPKEYFENYKG